MIPKYLNFLNTFVIDCAFDNVGIRHTKSEYFKQTSPTYIYKL
jgi:hypothetical protein